MNSETKTITTMRVSCFRCHEIFDVDLSQIDSLEYANRQYTSVQCSSCCACMYQCHYCPARYSTHRKSNIRNHLKNHTEEEKRATINEDYEDRVDPQNEQLIEGHADIVDFGNTSSVKSDLSLRSNDICQSFHEEFVLDKCNDTGDSDAVLHEMAISIHGVHDN